ncbi:hypothetical protein [Enterocloster citroniae]
MDKDKLLIFLDKEIKYHDDLVSISRHDGMMQNQSLAVIRELEMIKTKIEDDSYLEDEIRKYQV